MERDDKLKLKAKGPRSYRTTTTLLGGPQQERFLKVRLITTVEYWCTYCSSMCSMLTYHRPLSIGFTQEVDLDALETSWLCQSERDSTANRITRILNRPVIHPAWKYDYNWGCNNC